MENINKFYRGKNYNDDDKYLLLSLVESYGLIVPGKNKMMVQAPGKRAAIFDEDSDSDEPSSAKPVFHKPPAKKQIKIAQDKLVEEDPTVYQYDEIYDDMEKQRNESKLLKKGVEKKPKYINNLLKAAERRKRENERRIDRQVQKERETEGDEFKDKESFVTPSYQKKLEEMKLLEEQEKREEYLEAIGDVKKQGNLDGFYRHFYDQKVNYKGTSEAEVKEEKVITVKKENSSEDEEPLQDEIKKKNTKKRQYRKREESLSEDEIQNVKKEHIPSNLDADSDFSIDSSDSEEENSTEAGIKDVQKNTEAKETAEIVTSAKEDVTEKPDINNVNDNDKEKTEEVRKKPKVDIYKKRTVGDVFEEARIRYFERRAMVQSG